MGHETMRGAHRRRDDPLPIFPFSTAVVGKTDNDVNDQSLLPYFSGLYAPREALHPIAKGDGVWDAFA